jgi:hypothetical protein
MFVAHLLFSQLLPNERYAPLVSQVHFFVGSSVTLQYFAAFSKGSS